MSATVLFQSLSGANHLQIANDFIDHWRAAVSLEWHDSGHESYDILINSYSVLLLRYHQHCAV